jgi:hypothetical protein
MDLAKPPFLVRIAKSVTPAKNPARSDQQKELAAA